jgi:lipoprotein-releasing system ATP-binding protein
VTEYVLELRSVSRRLAGEAGRTLFEGVSLALEAGSWTTVTGPSGSGKTALLELMGLLRRPEAGEIRLSGRIVDWSSPAVVTMLRGRHIGFVFQLPALDESATALDNALDGIRLSDRRCSDDEIDRLRSLAERVGIGQLLDRRVDGLSGGEKQRISVLRALGKRPSLLLADEPTASLDRRAHGQVIEALDRAADEGAAVVVVTHDARLIGRRGQTLAVERGGLMEASTSGGDS